MTIFPQKVEFSRPGSVEVEQAILGASILNEAAFDCARDKLVLDDFSEGVHRAIWQAIGEARDAGSVTPQTLAARLGSVSETDLGGLTLSTYIARLATSATTIMNAPTYCDLVRDNADRRRLADAFYGLPDALAGAQPISDITAHLMSVCDAVAARRASGATKRVNMSQALAKAIDAAAEAYRNGGAVTGITWGCKSLDEAMGGLHRGELVLQMGRPSMGKTAMAISIAKAAATAGWPVLFFSLEMTDAKLASRMISSACFERGAIPYFIIDKGRFTEAEFGRVKEGALSIEHLPIMIDPQSRLSPAQLTSRVRRWSSELSRDGLVPGLVIVDYIGLMAASDRYAGRRVDEVSELSAGLKTLAKEYNVPVLALSQMSRNAENRDDKRPQLSDLRDSGSLEQDADAVLGLFRPAYHLMRKVNRTEDEDFQLEREKNLLEAIVLKQRNGPVGVHKLFCAVESNFIGDWQG